MPDIPIHDRDAGQAIAPGRMGYDLDARRLLLHTIVTPGTFEVLRSTGTLVPDTALAEPDFADAYEWMYRQMSDRLPTRGEGALWFWARTRREHLVSLCRSARGDILLTCRIPRERVLLSHFGDWHAVLNRWPATVRISGESEDESIERLERTLDDFDRRLRRSGVRFAPVRDWPATLRDDIERSWQYILDRNNYGSFECWQATTHELSVDDVVEATRINRL